MKDVIIKDIIKDENRGRVSFHVLIDGKKKYWNVAKGVFELLEYLIAERNKE